MVVLLVLLLLTNLWFGWAVSLSPPSMSPNPMSPSIQDPSMSVYHIIIQGIDSIKRTQKEKKETCDEVKGVLTRIAANRDWTSEGKIVLPGGAESYKIDKECNVRRHVPVGMLSPARDSSFASYPQGMITGKDFKFQPDVKLFKTLFLMLMYAAAIFWAVRTAQRFVAGELTESFISFFIGVIIVATMYVLYRWMPA